MIELLGGKAGALCGKFQDGSAFRKGSGVNDNVETIRYDISIYLYGLSNISLLMVCLLWQ